MRVGIFDSGLGGINVLSCLIDKFPNNQYVFYGDTKNLPYGDKSKTELLSLSTKAIEFLLTKKVDIIIIACGTISSTCYQELKEKYNIPILDIISPTIHYLEQSQYQNIGVIGTKRTIESNIFNFDKKNVIAHATPTFVSIIENDLINKEEENIMRELSMFKDCDCLVLGCTHYPLLKDVIHTKYHYELIDMGKCLTDNLTLTNNSKASYDLYFSQINKNLLQNIQKIIKVKYHVNLVK